MKWKNEKLVSSQDRLLYEVFKCVDNLCELSDKSEKLTREGNMSFETTFQLLLESTETFNRLRETWRKLNDETKAS
jgi:hypothetical protein